MSQYIFLLNSIPMICISGVFLFASFITEYIVPMYGGTFVFAINPAWVSLCISGTPLAYMAIRNTSEMRITSPLLITIAMIAAVYIDDIFAAGEVAFIMAIGEWLEDRTVEKAKKGITGLLNLVPNTGRKITQHENGTLEESVLPAEDIHIGDTLRVLPGESFPADGMIVSGNTTVDQSIMTGESLPVDKKEQDEVFTGTINCFGSVDIKVTKAFQQSSLQKMIQLVAAAEQNKAPTQKTVDRWAAYLVPTACIIAIITYCVFNFVLHEPEAALLRAVTVLVVFCPCALALATPTSIMAAIGQATKNGVLIKSGEALEKMGQVRIVAFDKTGTLTHGKLTVSDIIPLHLQEESLLSVVASVESRSEHPIGKSIMAYVKKQAIAVHEGHDFSMSVGKGVFANIEGKRIYCGNETLIEEAQENKISKAVEQIVLDLREEGKAVVIVADKEHYLGVIALSDTIKTTAAKAVADLKEAEIEETVLLTGDNAKSARVIAHQVGITNVYSSLLPEAKVEAIKTLSQTGRRVCMIGDGVNDAPALKTAHVGVAMGTMGSDIAIDAADIAIMGDDISKIAYLKKLSLATIFSIKFNIILSMAINFAAIIFSIAGVLTPATGALVHNAGSVLVVLNAARLYEKKIL